MKKIKRLEKLNYPDVDEIAEPDYEEVNLDTQRSAKGKANIKNVTQSSPLTF